MLSVTVIRYLSMLRFGLNLDYMGLRSWWLVRCLLMVFSVTLAVYVREKSQ